MRVKSLKITNFKNIGEADFLFSPKLNCLLGDNGMGKSNLLDALYTLSFCKSFTGLSDGQLIRRGETFAMLSGRYHRRGLDEELLMGFQQGRRKSLKRGGKEYSRLSEHIGGFPLVVVSPADSALVEDGAEERRRYLDQIISQRDGRYLEALQRYGGALKQRNAMLKAGEDNRGLFAAVEMQMEMAGEYLTECRRKAVEELRPLFAKYYGAIAGSDEGVTLSYRSSMVDGGLRLGEIFEKNRRRDEILRHTSSGPHRDDIELTIGEGLPVRGGASQGQLKTITMAMRFAQYELLRESLGIRPLLLLDDIFDKLDSGRVGRIMKLITDDGAGTFGQIFVTDTNRKHLDEIISELPRMTSDGEEGYRLWSVDGGRFTPIEQ